MVFPEFSLAPSVLQNISAKLETSFKDCRLCAGWKGALLCLRMRRQWWLIATPKSKKKDFVHITAIQKVNHVFSALEQFSEQEYAFRGSSQCSSDVGHSKMTTYARKIWDAFLEWRVWAHYGISYRRTFSHRRERYLCRSCLRSQNSSKICSKTVRSPK